MQVLKQPVCTPEQARQLLVDLKAAYQSLGVRERAEVRSELGLVGTTTTTNVSAHSA